MRRFKINCRPASLVCRRESESKSDGRSHLGSKQVLNTNTRNFPSKEQESDWIRLLRKFCHRAIGVPKAVG